MNARELFQLGTLHKTTDPEKAICYFKQIPFNEKEFKSAIYNIILISTNAIETLEYLKSVIPNFDVNTKLFDEYTILQLLKILDAPLSMIDMYIKLGANPFIPNKYGETPLSSAIFSNNIDEIKFYIEHMGYKFEGDYEISHTGVKEITDIYYYLHKMFVNHKDDIINLYGSIFYNECYNQILDRYIENPNNKYFCLFLLDNRDLINECLKPFGYKLDVLNNG